jgi:hypothetical protein
MGELGRGESAAIEQRREHRRSCRLSDQSSNLGYQRRRGHGLNVAAGTARPQAPRTWLDASITVEVSIAAPGRIGGKIAALGA